MQNKVDRLGMKFEFKDIEDSEGKSSDKAIPNLQIHCKMHKVLRGRYGQSLLEKWTSDNASKKGLLFEEQWINIIELDTKERFKIALSEVGPVYIKEIHFAEKKL